MFIYGKQVYNKCMRYIQKQVHKNTCALVSVLNARKWLGRSISYRIKYLEYLNKTKLPINSFSGISGYQLDKILKREFLKRKPITRFELMDI